jgi:hypothetical protein
MTNANGDVREWLARQASWIREAATRLSVQGQLTADDVHALVLLMQTEVQPVADGATPFLPNHPQALADKPLVLLSIGDIEGIERLGPQEPLALGGNLTVIYGPNGSGKSGYARILKCACGKLHARALLANVFQDPPKSRRCTIRYKMGDGEETIEWNAKDRIPELGGVDIFDASTGRSYIDSENVATYVPPVVGLFEGLVEACALVLAEIEKTKQTLPCNLPALPPTYADSAAGKQFTALAAATGVKDIATLTDWCETDEQQLRVHNERLAASPQDLARSKRNRLRQVDLLRESLTAALEAGGQQSFERISKLIDAAQEKRRIAADGIKALKANSPLEGVGSPTWRSLWEAARAYSQAAAYGQQAYPVVSSAARCVLCQQDLSADGKKRLIDFESYVTGKLETDAQRAEKARDEAFAGLPVAPSDAELTQACLAAGLGDDETKLSVRDLWANVTRQADCCRKGSQATVDVAWRRPADFPLLATLQGLSTELGEQIAQHDADSRDFDRPKVEAARLQLQCRKWTSQQKQAIETEIKRLHEIARLEGLKAKANPAPISRKLGALSDELITDEYVYRFNEELRKLGAPRLQVELVRTRVDHARPYHTVRLKNPRDPVAAEKILSEGEMRVVSLASFLADTTASARKMPFIFDDPISSLDHDFEWAVARRLAELAQTRQVIVFTHRLSLYGAMEDAAKKNGKDWHKLGLCKKCIERFGESTGRPSQDWAAKPDVTNNQLLDRLKKLRTECCDVGDSEGYQVAAKSICSEFRKLLERTVEEDLLSGVVKRHRRSVTTDNLIFDLAKIMLDDCKCIDDLMTKYSFFEHSQSEETPVTLPDEPELRADLERLKEWRTQFKKRTAK